MSLKPNLICKWVEMFFGCLAELKIKFTNDWHCSVLRKVHGYDLEVDLLGGARPRRCWRLFISQRKEFYQGVCDHSTSSVGIDDAFGKDLMIKTMEVETSLVIPVSHGIRISGFNLGYHCCLTSVKDCSKS